MRLARRHIGLGLALGLAGLGGGLGGLVPPAIAAEDIVFHYRAHQRTVAVADLTNLATTGDSSRQLSVYLRQTGQSPEALRTMLNREVELDPVFLDRILNSPLGGLALDQIGTAFSTSSGEANQQALRAALVLAASDDGQVSTLELLQTYPTPELHVDGDRLSDVYAQLVSLEERFGWLLP